MDALDERRTLLLESTAEFTPEETELMSFLDIIFTYSVPPSRGSIASTTTPRITRYIYGKVCWSELAIYLHNDCGIVDLPLSKNHRM
jgi:hypothetical protein